VPPFPSTGENITGKQQSKLPSLGQFFEAQKGQLGSRNQNNIDNVNTTEQQTLAEETAVSDCEYDSIMDNSRWGAVAIQHDIDMKKLRKLCSQGGVDEAGSWRGVAWRVLLGYLPTRDIEKTWPNEIPSQRSFYMTLVNQYIHVKKSDLNGRELRGHLSKKLRDRQLRRNYNHVGNLNDSCHGRSEDHYHDDQQKNNENPAKLNNRVNAQENANENAEDGDDEDLIDACIRHGSLQTFQSRVAPTAVAGATTSTTVTTTINRKDSNSEHNNDSQNQEISDHSFSDRTFNDSDHALQDTNGLDEEEDNLSQQTPEASNENSNINVIGKKTRRSLTNESSTKDQDTEDMFQAVADQLPSRFREEWIASGMNSLDQRASTPNASFSVASLAAINRLVVPKPLVEAAQRELLESSEGRVGDEHDDDSSTAHSTTSSSPATLSLDEIFQIFLQDAQSLEQIRKDVVRTHQDLRFYLEPDQNLGVRRCAALERILYIWSKLNKGVRYVQGMNEIVGTLFYVLANDLNSDWSNAAEADTYYLFQTLLLEFQDVFMPELDDTKTGIQGRMANVERLLQTHDPSLQAHLNDLGIDSSFFLLRWLGTLMSREFLLPDTIRLWDSMFSSTHKENFLRYVCGTMVMMIREDILKNDLAGCLRLLQSYPPTNIDDILQSSKALWLYESQITLAVTKGGISLQQALQTIRPPPTIIFAFGLPGGVPPPTVSEVVQEKAQQTAAAAAARAEQATAGLFGRAKRIWNGWGSSGSSVTSMTSEIIMDGAEATVTGEDYAAKSIADETKLDRADNGPSDRASSHNSLTSDTVSPPTEVVMGASTTIVPTILQGNRFWNRGRSGSTSSSILSNQSSPTSPPTNVLTGNSINAKVPDVPNMPDPPSRFWNRGG
jgi:Rab-GTPase-TBC domain